ncbi:MAG TPA: hypothetical protein VGZ28_08355, partial [Terriglobales bacterium]|nr:hypothetical protein [Terriglobales bacterium]
HKPSKRGESFGPCLFPAAGSDGNGFSLAAGRYAEPGQLAALLRQIATPVGSIRLFSALTRLQNFL